MPKKKPKDPTITITEASRLERYAMQANITVGELGAKSQELYGVPLEEAPLFAYRELFDWITGELAKREQAHEQALYEANHERFGPPVGEDPA